MNEDLNKALILLAVAIAPIIIGTGLWVFGIFRKNKKVRHQGFLMMMTSLILIFMLLGTLAVVLLYMYFANR